MNGRVILASASPRRKEICALMELPADIVPARSEPLPDTRLSPEQAVLAVARAKAEEVAADYPGRTVIGADTVVVCGKEILGKPRNAQQARDMLHALQGTTHRVLTGVWVCTPRGGNGFVEAASVTFYPMTEQEIQEYIATGEPMDKAGAYGIQGKGMRYIRGIEGDFYTVMGLPGARLWRFLRALMPDTPR